MQALHFSIQTYVWNLTIFWYTGNKFLKIKHSSGQRKYIPEPYVTHELSVYNLWGCDYYSQVDI